MRKNEMKLRALDKIYSQMNTCALAFEYYENADSNMKDICENVWTTEEDKLAGMRTLYRYIFDENCSYTRTEIVEKIEALAN